MTRTKKILMVLAATLLVAVAFIVLTAVVASEAIMSYNDSFANETGEAVSLQVEYIDRQNEDLFWKEFTLTLQPGETYTHHVRHVRFLPECIHVEITSGNDVWFAASSIETVINGAWNDLPSAREYRFTGEERESMYCRNTYSQ